MARSRAIGNFLWWRGWSVKWACVTPSAYLYLPPVRNGEMEGLGNPLCLITTSFQGKPTVPQSFLPRREKLQRTRQKHALVSASRGIGQLVFMYQALRSRCYGQNFIWGNSCLLGIYRTFRCGVVMVLHEMIDVISNNWEYTIGTQSRDSASMWSVSEDSEWQRRA